MERNDGEKYESKTLNKFRRFISLGSLGDLEDLASKLLNSKLLNF